DQVVLVDTLMDEVLERMWGVRISFQDQCGPAFFRIGNFFRSCTKVRFRAKDFFAPSSVLSVAVCLIPAPAGSWASQLYYFPYFRTWAECVRCNPGEPCEPTVCC